MVRVGFQLRSWLGREFFLFFPAAANDRYDFFLYFFLFLFFFFIAAHKIIWVAHKLTGSVGNRNRTKCYFRPKGNFEGRLRSNSSVAAEAAEPCLCPEFIRAISLAPSP